jgi:predicted dinucleotide-binding enzyme
MNIAIIDAGNVGKALGGSSTRAGHSVVLAVPYPAVDAILDELGDAPAGKVVVDVTNPLNAESSGLAVEGTSAAEEIQRKAGAAQKAGAPRVATARRVAVADRVGTRGADVAWLT